MNNNLDRLCFRAIFCFVFCLGTIVLIAYPFKFFYEDSTLVRFTSYFVAGVARWLFIIGVYGVTREVVTSTHPIIPVLSELSMPFYLIHQQILVIIASACSWVPYLSEIITDLGIIDISSHRNVPHRAGVIHSSYSGGGLAHHQVWTNQIFLWITNKVNLSTAWKKAPWIYSSLYYVVTLYCDHSHW